MLLFTAKTRGLIDRAVSALPEQRRRVWTMWAEEHPNVRVPDGPVDDGSPPPPRDVVFVVIAALEEFGATKRRRLAARDVSEDEISDLENDLTYIGAVSEMLNRMPAR
jgi:hypothetical protein